MSLGYVSPNLREKVLTNLWTYLDRHFENMSEANKIKFVLALCTKNIPTQVEGNYTSTTKMEVIKVDQKPLEYELGNNRTSVNTQHPN